MTRLNDADLTATKPRLEAEMTDGEVIGCSRWPAWFTVDQMRAQLRHEEAGCPPPFPSAEWDGHGYRGPSWPGHSAHKAS